MNRHQRGADAQSVPRLERVHEWKALTMAKTTATAKPKSAALRVAKGRGVAQTAKPARQAARRSSAADPQREIEQLLYRQSECLDSKDWQGFTDPFPKHAIYFVP